MHYRIFVLLISVFLLISCSIQKESKQKSDNYAFTSSNETKEINRFFTDTLWIRDSFGCDGYRLKQMDIYYVKSDSFIGMDTNTIIKLLGKPNKTHKLEDEIWYVYWVSVTELCEVDLNNINFGEVVPGLTFNFVFDPTNMKVVAVYSLMH